MNRAVFYSRNDMSIFTAVERIDAVMCSLDLEKDFTIDDILELFQILVFFEENIFPARWNEKEKESFKIKIPEIKSVIISFFNSKKSNELLELYPAINFQLRESFWQVLDRYNLYKLIDSGDLVQLLNSENFVIRIILQFKKIVDFFKVEIKNFLITNFLESTQLMLTEFEQKKDFNHKKLFFPDTLSFAEKEEIILNYINSNRPNLNYISLIINSRYDKNLRLDDRTKLKAKRVYEKINEEFFAENTGFKYGTSICLSLDSDIPIDISHSEGTINVTYGCKYFDKITDNIQLLEILKENFFFLDQFNCLDLVQRNVEITSLEHVFVKSKNSYQKGLTFRHKFITIQGALQGYIFYLSKRNLNIEDLLSNYVNNYLNDKYDIKKFTLKLSDNNTSFLDKITTLIPQIDSIVKQYKLYVEDGYVDYELLQISSVPLKFGEIPSKSDKKYYYIKSQKVYELFHYFFASLGYFYLEKMDHKIDKNFFDFLMNNDISIDEFQDFQKQKLQDLIDENYLYIDEKGFIKILNLNFFYVLKILYNYEVLNYYSVNFISRPMIDLFENIELIFKENTLFTKAEQDLLNFLLNKSTFTDGFDIRNKYVHGTNPHDEETIKNDYYIILMVLIMIVFKIDDDLRAATPKIKITI